VTVDRVTIQVALVDPDTELPSYQTRGSAGLDILASLAEPLTIHPGERHLVPSGLRLAIPDGYEGQIRPRSGLALKHGITVLNSPGTIDSDYRGEVKVLLVNLGKEPFEVRSGDRIAQLVVARVDHATLMVVDGLSETERGEGGYGSTGC